MRSLSALRMLGIGLAFAALLASGGLPVSSQTGTEELGSFIVTASFPDNTVAFVDLLPGGGTSVTRVAVPDGPIGVAIHPSRLFTYVVSWTANTMTIIDNHTRGIVRTVNLGVGANPYSIAFRPDGTAYVVSAGHKTLDVYDAQLAADNPWPLRTVVLEEPVAPRNVAIAPNGRLVAVSDSESGRIQIIDAVTQRWFSSLDIGGQCAVSVQFSYSDRWLAVGDRCLSTVSIIDLETIGSSEPSIETIPMSPKSGVWHLAFSPDDRFLFASLTEPREGTSSGEISVIDMEEKRQVGTIKVGGFPAGLQVIVRTPDPGDRETWHYVLLVFNPQGSIQWIPINIETGVPIGPSRSIPTGLSKNLVGVPVCDGLFCREADTAPVLPRCTRFSQMGEVVMRVQKVGDLLVGQNKAKDDALNKARARACPFCGVTVEEWDEQLFVTRRVRIDPDGTPVYIFIVWGKFHAK